MTELECMPKPIVLTGFFGKTGVHYLESVWDQYVRCFYENPDDLGDIWMHPERLI